jgi:hypothetical protein
MDRTGGVLDVANDVEGCLAAVHAIGLASLLTLHRPVLAAEIRRVGDQARQEPYRYSAFGSFVDLPPASERGRRDVAIEAAPLP